MPATPRSARAHQMTCRTDEGKHVPPKRFFHHCPRVRGFRTCQRTGSTFEPVVVVILSKAGAMWRCLCLVSSELTKFRRNRRSLFLTRLGGRKQKGAKPDREREGLFPDHFLPGAGPLHCGQCVSLRHPLPAGPSEGLSDSWVCTIELLKISAGPFATSQCHYIKCLVNILFALAWKLPLRFNPPVQRRKMGKAPWGDSLALCFVGSQALYV